MPIEIAITPHRNLVQCFATTYSPRDDIFLWELQEQASCLRAVTLINWNIRDDVYFIFLMINSRNTKKRKICFII